MSTFSVQELKEQVGHPLIDGRGCITAMPEGFVRFVREHGEEQLLENPYVRRLLGMGESVVGFPSLEQRRRYHTGRHPSFRMQGNTLDYATSTMPGLMYERIGEQGFDFAVVYPTTFLHLPNIPEADACRGLCRLYNEMVAEDFAPYRDRLAPVGVLPFATPEEGVEELEHAFSLGLRAFLLPTYEWRTIPAFADAPPELRDRLRRPDHFGLDSEYDYDPFWGRASELNVALSTLASGAFLVDHVSPSNSFFSSGHFPAMAEMCAKSLFLGGVLHRFPKLRVALLESGVAVGVRLYAELISRFKSGVASANSADSEGIDTAKFAELARKYNPRLAELPEKRTVRMMVEEEGGDFDACGARSAEDVRDQFCSGLYWTCRVEDPLIRLAFDAGVNPLGAVLPAFVGSGMGQWSVRQQYECSDQLERGLLTPEQFRDFTLTNALRFYSGGQPDFFAGTVLESTAQTLTASAAS